MIEFEWDLEKAHTSESKHGVSFEEAATIFGDPLSVTIPDRGHSEAEARFVTFGQSGQERVLAVMHTDRGDTIRIISARLATPNERREYEEGGLGNGA